MIRVSVAIVLTVCLLLGTSFLILDSIIKKKIKHQFENLSAATDVKFSYVKTSFFSSSVSFDSLEIYFTPYSSLQQNRHVIKFSRASLQGISFYEFLFHKKLVAKNLLLDEGNIQLDQLLLDKKDSLQPGIIKKIKWPFKNLDIKNVELKRTMVFLQSGQTNQLLGRGDVNFAGVVIDAPGGKPVFAGLDAHLSDINYALANHKIVISRLEINSHDKKISVDSLQVLSRTNDYSQGKISSIKISGINITKLLHDHLFVAQKIIVAGSSIAIDNSLLNSQSLPFDLKKIYVETFKLDQSVIRYRDRKGNCRFNADVDLHDLTMYHPFDKDHIHFRDIRANLSRVQYAGNNYQATEIKKLEIDSKEGVISAHNVNLTSRVGKYELGRKLGHQADWVAANISVIEIIKPDIEKLWQQNLLAEKIAIGRSRIYVFRDRRLARQQKILPLPVEFLQKLPFDIRVKTLTLASSTVEYEEYPKSGFGQTGVLKIKNARVAISPLVNHPVPSDPAYIVMNATGSIMGSGSAHGTIMMPMNKNQPYHIRGSIDKLELTTLNSSSENLGKIRIKSGFLDFLFFDFTMTEQRSTGKIVGAYHHLIIQQLKKHTEERNVADFASFMLRHLIIPLNKDRSLPERMRTGLVNYARDPTRFVSYYFLQSLLTGVKKSFTLGFLLPK